MVIAFFNPHSFCMTDHLETLFLISSYLFQIHSYIISPSITLANTFLLVTLVYFVSKFINRLYITLVFLLREARRQAQLSYFHKAGSLQILMTLTTPHSHHLVSILSFKKTFHHTTVFYNKVSLYYFCHKASPNTLVFLSSCRIHN